MTDTVEEYGTGDQVARSADSVARLHRLLIESVVDYAIFVLDARGHILTWNPGAERLKGYAPHEIIGKHFSIFYPPEDWATRKFERELRDAIRDGRVEDEGWRLRKDGSRFWANVVITRLTDRAGNLVGFAKVTRDLTARREGEELARQRAIAEGARAGAERRAQELAQLNEQLQQQAIELEAQTEAAQALTQEVEIANEALQEALVAAEQARRDAEAADRAKTDFLRTVSHELRTPLNAVEGYVQLLQMGIPDPPSPAQANYLGRIQNAERHLLSLVDNLLSLSRIEAGHVESSIEPLAVRELWDAVEPLVTPQMRAKGLGYHVGPCSPDIRVRADRQKAVQVLLNLVSNAVKFTEPGGQIGLETEVRPTDVALQVRDTGCGIEPDQLARVFEPFVRGEEPGPLARASGAGLGLSIARQFARLMGGDVTVESTVGAGSTFTLTLPRAQ